MTLQIWHNPRCSKSRQTLALLQERGLQPEIRLYLKEPPSVAELRDVLARLGLSAREIVRSKEKAFAEAGLTPASDEAALLDAMVRHPILIERPIVVNGDRAALGRPPEAVLDIL